MLLALLLGLPLFLACLWWTRNYSLASSASGEINRRVECGYRLEDADECGDRK